MKPSLAERLVGAHLFIIALAMDLAEAVFDKELGLLRSLLSQGHHDVDAKLRHRDDITILHLAIAMSWPEGVQTLVDAGASLSAQVYYDGYGFDDYDFKTKFKNGDTALQIAQMNKEAVCERILLKALQSALNMDVSRVKSDKARK